MDYKMQFAILLFTYFVLVVKASEDNCTILKNEFAVANGEFVNCAINNARPIGLCRNCVDSYINITQRYFELGNATDNTSNCLMKFENLDTLQILPYIYKSNVELWTNAHCDGCFMTINKTLTPTLSNKTYEFYQLQETLQNCINSSKGKSELLFCQECLKEYRDVNDYYSSIQIENEEKVVCMDVVDAMNSTRLYWSNKCPLYRYHNEVVFISSASLLLLVTAIFYIIAKFCTDKKLAAVLPQTRFYGSLTSSNSHRN